MQCFMCMTYVILFSKTSALSSLQTSTNEPEASKDMMERGELPNNLQSAQNTQEGIGDEAVPSSVNGPQTEPSENTKTIIGFNVLSMLMKPDIATSKPMADFSDKYKESLKDMMMNSKNSSITPMINEMEDMSQIGDTDRLTIINPTVIVNFRGTVLNREPDIKLKNRRKNPGAKQFYHDRHRTEKVAILLKMEYLIEYFIKKGDKIAFMKSLLFKLKTKIV